MKTLNTRRWGIAGLIGMASFLWVAAFPMSGQAAFVPYNLWLDVDSHGSITNPIAVTPGSMTDYMAIPLAGTNVTAVAAPGYVFSYWEIQEGPVEAKINPGVSNASITVRCSTTAGGPNTNITLMAHFKQTDITLSVISTNNWGVPMVPSVGNSTWANAANISASVNSPYDIGVGKSAICTGFVGTGSVPASGNTTNVSFQITTNSTLTWLWRVQSELIQFTVVSTNASGVIVGNPQPPQGTTNVAYNSARSASVTSPWTVSSDERAEIVGYVGTGDAPTGNGGLTPMFQTAVDSTLRWNWKSKYLLRKTLFKSGTSDGDVQISPPGTPEGTPVIGYWYDSGTVVTLTPLPAVGSVFSGWSGDVTGFGIKTVTMTNKMSVTASFRDVIPGEIPEAWLTKFGLDPNDPNVAWEDPDNDGLSNLQEYWVSHVYASNTAGYVECSPINADSDGDGMDDGYEFYKILAPGATNSVPGSQKNFMAVVDVHGANGPDGNPDGDFHWSTRTGYKTDIGLTTGEEYVGPDGIAPGSYVTLTIPGVSKPVKAFCYQLGLATNSLYYLASPDTGDQSSSDSTDSEIAGFDGKSGDGFDDGFEYSWDLWQSMNEDSAVGDPLGHRIPYHANRKPELPTSALIGPWFHQGSVTNDIAISLANYDRVSLYVNIGGGFLVPTNDVDLPPGSAPVAMAMGAFDVGVTNDIVVACSNNNTVCVLLRAPSNAIPFTVASYPAGVNPSFVTVGRFNNDAFQDIAVANSGGGGTVSVLTNNGAGGFALMTTLAVGGKPSSVAAGRIFGSITNAVPTPTLSDLLVSDGITNVLAFRCNTNNTFTLVSTTPVGAIPCTVVLSDFNLDNTNDFAVALTGDSLVKTYLGDGSGGFTLKGSATVGAKGYPLHLAGGDLNYSTDPFSGKTVPSNPIDLVASAYSNRSGRLFMGLPSGSLVGASAIDIAMRPVWSVVGDLTQDGLNDILFVCRDDDKISMWKGDGSGSFDFIANYGSSASSVGRPFNPAVVHDPPPGTGFPDYDLIYLPKGGVGNWFSDDLEYNAWSTNTIMYSLTSNTIVRLDYPNTPRSTNPFLWDTDGDGLPDGWEVVFGYDPWKKISFGGTVSDDKLNPDLDGHAMMRVITSIVGGVTNGNVLYDHDVYAYKPLYPNDDPYPPNGNTFANNFNPNTGWLDPRGKALNPPGIADTEAYANKLEMLGGRSRPAVMPYDPKDHSSNPRLRDTDGDGIWDGWELYVGLNPIDPIDAYLDGDRDGLSAWQEFMCLDTLLAEPSWILTNGVLVVPGNLTPEQQALISQRSLFVAGWQNKTRPTDPGNRDTDDDQIGDGAEMGGFNYSAGLAVPVLISDTNAIGDVTDLGVYAEGGGLTPTACDTDNDGLPDFWESSYAGGLIGTNGVWGGGMDGSRPDAFLDYDGDGLLNYQEYMTGSIYHWQYMYNNGSTAWTYGRGSWGYEPFDFFDDQRSATPAHPNGDAMFGPGGRRPKPWDAHFWSNKKLGKPFNFLTAAEPTPLPWMFSTTDPGNADSDEDGMDDYWETYHMLNPILGGLYGPLRDLVYEKATGFRPNYPFPPPPPDIINCPWVNGRVEMDWDQDGLPNIYESVQPQCPVPGYYHTDPSPYWLSDWSYNQSFTDLYYWSGFNFGILNWWYWNGTVINKSLPYYGPDFAPNYMFDFETNDGFDTDNDNLPDRAELVDTDASPGSTDPLDSGDPIKQRALYLNGQAAARTYSPTTINAWEQLREFTVEAWVRPQKPASGTEQVIIERAVGVANGNPLGYPSSIRANFRVGLDPDGRPFVGYHGAGFDPIFEECKTDISGALHPDEWAHLAGVYDGTAKKLILYVNGIMAAMKPTAEIPFNSWYGGAPSNPDIFNDPSGPFSSPLTIGARENNPIAWVDGVQFNVTCLAGLWAGANTRRQDPQLDHYFKGWVDEVHVFSGSTPQSTIVSRMKKRWTHQSVWAYNASVPITNAMMWAYSFDDIQDPDYGGVAPAGFDLLTGYMPGYVGIPWWMKAPDVSRVYTDYRYVPWIENLVQHVPYNPPADTCIAWNAISNAFPNSANPYTFNYLTATDSNGEWHPKSTGSFSASGDLLPLRWAVADEDVLMWDNSNSRLPRDSDGDGLPDDWEVAHGLDPRTGDGINGADGDPDGDGLSNFYEYLCGTDPWSVDSNGNGIWDMDEDSDGDGLSNREELRRLTLPNDKDTDDDGVSDWEEVTGSTDPAFDASRPATSRRPNGMTDPLNPLEPLIPRSMMFNGNARVLVPPSNKLMSRDWTVEMWVRPATNCNGGVLLSRYVKGLSAGQEGITYELGLSTNDIAVGVIRAYTRYAQTTNSVVVETRVDGTGATETLSPSQGVLIPLDKWTHLAGVHDSKTDTLALYVNGNLAAHRTDASAVPPTVYGYTVSHRGDEVTIGASRSTGAITNAFTGLLDEVRIWNVAKSAKDIGDRYNAPQAVASAASASASITLKNRTIPTTEGVSAEVAALPASQPTRLLVQFESSAVAGNSNALQAAGIKTLNYVSPTVRMVSATPAQLTALGHTVRWGGLLRPTDKLSSLLAVDGSHTNRQVLVKFFNDTAQTEAVQAVQAAGGTVYQNRYLGGHYLVATVNDAQLTALVGGNAVAWASPAAAFLTSGGPVHYFGDDIIKNGLEAAPFVTVGEGWDGPGRGSASLKYFFVNDTTKLTPSVARQAVVDQFAKISAVAALTFAETTVPAEAYSLDIAWYRGAHGDGADFDGPFGVLAHGFFPNDINPEPIAGDLHFDEDETWSIGSAGGIDIQYVGLHEIGHCVGLGHSADPGAVMYPFYDGSRAAVLAKDDIDALQSIYGEAQSLAEFRFDDGGVLAQDFSVKNDWLSGWASAAVLDGAVFWTNSTPFLDKDTDGDGMPDWWEIGHRLDPNDPTGDNGAKGDPDGDGLINLYEYECGTDPMNADTDHDGISDANEDTDNDGISNIDEIMTAKTDPGVWDTDDDGISDGDELNGSILKQGRRVTSPLYSRDPLVPRSMRMTGTAVTIPEPWSFNKDSGKSMQRFIDLNKWAVGCWVKLPSVQSGSLVVRALNTGYTNLILSLNANVPHVEFTGTDNVGYSLNGPFALPTNQWVCLLAVLDTEQGTLSLYIDDVLMASRIVTERCMTGAGVTTVGAGLTGWLDDLYIGDRIWSPGAGAPDFAFVLDASGSMSGQPLDDVKAAAKLAIDAMPQGAEAEIIMLQTTATLLQTFTSDKTKLKAAVDTLQADNTTGYIPALQMLVGSFSNRPPERARTAMFLSDGFPDQSPDAALIQSVSNAHIVVNTIGFGDALGNNPPDLVAIAAGTGGKFYSALTGDDLKTIMSGLVAFETTSLAGFYPFDDGGKTAEDFVHPMNWSYAMENVVFDATEYNREVCTFNWMFTDIQTRMPKWWMTYFLDTENADPYADPDQDGLVNLDEYILGLHPMHSDTDANMVKDGDEDSDGDGLLNRDERAFGTKPNNADTDDDGFSDGDEVNGSVLKNGLPATSPLYPRSPMIPRSLILNGAAVEVPEPLKIDFDVGYHAQRFQGLTNWVIGCVVNPATATETGSLVKRTTIAGQTHFELRLDNNIPKIRFNTPSGVNYEVTGRSALPSNEWSVLMATWVSSNQALNLYVDYAENSATGVVGECATGPGLTVIGEGIHGLMDDLYIADKLPDVANQGVNDYALVLDNSGSMDGDSLIQLQDAFHQVVELLPDESEMAIISFDSQATLRQAFTGDKAQLDSVIDALAANDGTEYTPALQLLKTIYTPRPAQRGRIAIFVSDGSPGTTPPASALAALKKAGITVHAVGINTYGYDTELRRIATSTGGKFFNAPTPDQLAEIMLGLVKATENKFKYAYYAFDDGGASAEDFGNLLDPDYAMVPFAYTNLGFTAATPFNTANDDSLTTLPKWWKDFFQLPPDANRETDDADGDGLNNLYEYLSGNDPMNPDTNHNGIPDGLEDTDNDGLNNIDEQIAGTMPMLPDTDDDGIADGADVSSPVAAKNALAPLVDRVLNLDGAQTSWVESSRMRDLPINSWTAEAWIRPDTLGAPVTLIGRQVEAGAWNYNLGLDAAGHAVARFTSSDLTRQAAVTSITVVAVGSWTHVAGSFDASNNVLVVYVNGALDGQVTTALSPARYGHGPLFMRAGQGFDGLMEEVMVYDQFLSEDWIRLDTKGFATRNNPTNGVVPVCYFRFDDGTNPAGTSGNPLWKTGQVQDFSPASSKTDWKQRWANSGTLHGSAAMITAPTDDPVRYTKMDSDGDGLPDAWEIEHGLNPNDGTGLNGPDGDADEDGLSNLYEYLAGTDPHNPDSNHNGITDGDEDSDGDGLSNLEEQRLGTLPNKKDTDDDGITDWEEVTGEIDAAYSPFRPVTSLPPKGISNPLDSLSPAVPRCVSLNGNARVIVPPSDKLMSENWSLEMWVRPSTNRAPGVLLSRYVGGLYAGQSGINYEMGLETNSTVAGTFRPYIRYASTLNATQSEVRVNGLGVTEYTNGLHSVPISTNTWTHLAGVYNQASNSLSLYVNGALAAYRVDATLVPPTAFGHRDSHWRDEITIGASRSTGPVAGGYNGLLDEVRIWNVPLSGSEIQDRYNAPQAIKVAGTNGTIRLKSRTIETSAGPDAALAALPDTQSVRMLVQFRSETDARSAAALAAAGIETLNYVSPQARVVKASREQVRSLGVRVLWSGLLNASDKVSALLGSSATPRNVLVQFFPDVTVDSALAVVGAAGGTAYQNRYIGGTYMVVAASDAQVQALASDNVVAWIMPAMDALTSGQPVYLLPEQKVAGVELAPFATQGNGWDGPGLGSAALKYFFMNYTPDVSQATTRGSVIGSMQKWAAVAALTFTEATAQGQPFSIDIGFYSGDHGDGSPFDGPFGVLAHAFFPNDINPEPIAGDLHFDEDETWRVGAGTGIDMDWVALHELGHSLGLGHSAETNAVMYPFYTGSRPATLDADDIAGIRALYGLPAGGPPEPPSGPGPWNPRFGPENVSLFRFDDGGLSAQDFSVTNDWRTDWASAAILDGAVFYTNTTPFLDKDTDSDGMPDWWEMANGLDPYVGTGADGGAADVDGDGLSNFAEYLAGTNPRVTDTDGDGFNDYDSRQGPGYRTYGERFDDGDGIPDIWEVLYKGPCLTTGKRGLDIAYYDANLDPDEDGWSNFAEYMSNTDPLVATNYPTPLVAVHVRYHGRLGSTLAEALSSTNGTRQVRMNFYHSSSMDGYPDATLLSSSEATFVKTFTTGHIHEGNNYVFAYLDVNGDGAYQPGTEPAGIGQFQPVNLGWGDINNVEIGLTDSLPGYPRFSWPAIPNIDRYVITNATTGFSKNINVPRNYWHEGDWLSVGTYGAPTGTVVMLISSNNWPEGYFTNIALLLPAVTLATPSIYTPHDTVYVYARNEIEFLRDTNATGYRFQIALTSNGAPVIATTNIVPFMDLNTVSKMALPVYAGDNYVPVGGNYASSVWTNGRYWARVQAFTPNMSSSWSSWSALNLNLQTPAAGGKSMIDGDVYYFGKISRGYGTGQTSNLTVIVQAFESPGFSGVPEAQVQISYRCDTNAPSARKGNYSLMGLGTKPYYVRAFVDMNGNRTLDSWEPVGFAFQSVDIGGYVPLKVDLSGEGSSARSDVRIVIRDRDTDDDQLPDGWEWMYFGTLSKGGYDIATNTLTLLRNYEIEPMDLDPTKTDYDADGLSDVYEITYDDLKAGRPLDVTHYDPYDPVTNPHGKDLNPAKWDTDGDGLSDGYEIAHGLNPLDPADGAPQIIRMLEAGETIPGLPKVSHIATVMPDGGQFSLTWQGQVGMIYEVQCSDDLKTWNTAPNGPTRYGEALHTYVDQSPRVNTRFYRVVVR